MLGLALLLAGCVGNEGPGVEEDPSAGTTQLADQRHAEQEPWGGRERVTILDVGGEVTEFDVLCALGGGPRLERTDERVPPGTDHLEINVDVDETFTGLQVGYALDEHPKGSADDQEGVTWTDPVRGTATFHIPVEPANGETDGTPRRWAFYEQMNPGVEAACYTGGGTGEWSIIIEAVRGAR